MIDVKGTRTQAQDSDPAERYLTDTDRKSKVPLAIGAMLMGIALYLRSIFPAEAEPREMLSPTEKSGRAGGSPRPVEPEVEEALQEPRKKAPAPDDQASDASMPSGEAAGRHASMPLAAVGPLSRPHAVEREHAGAEPSPKTMTPANDNLKGGSPPMPAGYHGSGGSVEGDAPDHDGADPSALEEGEPEQNRAPRVAGAVTLREVSGTALLAIGLSHLLEKAVDPDGHALFVKNLSASSGVLAAVPGGWIFQASPGWIGPVTLSYEITDGQLSVSQTAQFSVVDPTLQDEGQNALLGTATANDGADDVALERDVGSGAVAPSQRVGAITGSDADDILLGTRGDDIISGGDGHDLILGGDGADRLFGQAGNDTLRGEAGADALSGGAGDDMLSGGSGNDQLEGDEGADTLDGGDGDDLIEGGAGNDLLLDGAGRDVVFGGVGDDVVVVTLADETDIFAGGAGSDTIDYSGTSAGVVIDLVAGTASGLEVGQDTISGFETIIGGDGSDRFVVGGGAMVLTGGAGENEFEFSYESSEGKSYSVIHEILDFKVGDLIRMSKYEIFEELIHDAGSQIEDAYSGMIHANKVPIRYRQETTETIERTLIEADLDRDDVYEMTIELQGNHALVIVEQA